MIFASAALALEWAETILSIREGGRSNAAMMEQLSGGAGKDYAVLDAIEIRDAAKRACWCSLPCPLTRRSCLFHWLLPDPCIEYPQLSRAQEDRIMECVVVFEGFLAEKNFMERIIRTHAGIRGKGRGRVDDSGTDRGDVG